MTEIFLNTSKISIPTSTTAATLFFSTCSEQNQLPSEYYPLPLFKLNNIWEEQYLPTNNYDTYSDKMLTIHKFALNLLQESEDIPEEFAKIINEDFWEII